MNIMDNLKFRVWDFLEEKFDNQIYKIGEPFGHPSSCDWVAQQYTGIKGKNKKEIYEGDIIEFEYSCGDFAWEEMSEEEREAEMKIYNKTFRGVIKQKILEPCNLEIVSDNIYFPLFYANDSRVIGNIFENPELLG
jgi:uncharacterized phage protein (TIGR01671 family)